MSEPFDHLLEKYARRVIRVGVNVQPGQEVVVNALPEQADVARALAEEAYRVGAVRVTIEYQDRHVQRSAVLHAPEESLGRTPLHRLEGVRAWRESRPAVITLTGNPWSRHLGEVAIVDRDSRVAATGLVYRDMLFDENVGSHIAWGFGFPTAFRGMVDRSPDERVSAGLNQAATHVDVVVGSPDVQIDGIHADGSVVAVTRGDEFVLED